MTTEEYDAQAIDMWGLGTLLYVVLCKQMPYTDAETCRRTTDMPAIPWKPTHVWARISAEVKEVVQGLLCPSPEDRLTAEAVLKHPWIVSHCGACELEQEESMDQVAAAIMEEIEARGSRSSADSLSSGKPSPAGAGRQINGEVLPARSGSPEEEAGADAAAAGRGRVRRGRVGGISSGKMADMLAAADEPAENSPAAAGAS